MRPRLRSRLRHLWWKKEFLFNYAVSVIQYQRLNTYKRSHFDIKVPKLTTCFAKSFLFLVSESTEETTTEITTITTDHSILVSSTSDCANTQISPAGRGMKRFFYFSKASNNLFFLAAPTIAWYFENNLEDSFGVYDGTGLNNPTYGLGRNGCGTCLNLTRSLNQSVLVNVTPYILIQLFFHQKSSHWPTINVCALQSVVQVL
jgi:hypothetical protein